MSLNKSYIEYPECVDRLILRANLCSMSRWIRIIAVFWGIFAFQFSCNNIPTNQPNGMKGTEVIMHLDSAEKYAVFIAGSYFSSYQSSILSQACPNGSSANYDSVKGIPGAADYFFGIKEIKSRIDSVKVYNRSDVKTCTHFIRVVMPFLISELQLQTYRSAACGGTPPLDPTPAMIFQKCHISEVPFINL